MTKYLVEARLTYEVEAATADDALRSVSASIQDGNAVDVEYRVRRRNEPAEHIAPAPDDYQGLDKPVYTVAEVASMLRTSRSAVYEMVRRGIKCIRMGRRMLIPRGTVLAILSGEVRLNDGEARPQPTPPRRRGRREQKPSRAEVITPVRRQRMSPEPPEPKKLLSLTEAARMLRISVPQLRQLVAERKIYYIDNGPRQQIPLRAIEAFANGLPAKAVLEENIAHVKAGGGWDDEMEQTAAKLLAEWTIPNESRTNVKPNTA